MVKNININHKKSNVYFINYSVRRYTLNLVFSIHYIIIHTFKILQVHCVFYCIVFMLFFKMKK